MIIYLDTETTGLCPGEICQLSYVIQEKGKFTAKNFFFSVEYVEPSAEAVHGFSVERLEKLSGGKNFSAFIDEIESDFTKADCLVAHNKSFDFNFLLKEFSRCGRTLEINDSFCSMKSTVGLCKLSRPNSRGYKYPKLIELCDKLGITQQDIAKACQILYGENVGFHDARFDTVAVAFAVNIGVNRFEEFKGLKEYL